MRKMDSTTKDNSLARNIINQRMSNHIGKPKCSWDEIQKRSEEVGLHLLIEFAQDVQKPSMHALLKARASLIALMLRPVCQKKKRVVSKLEQEAKQERIEMIKKQEAEKNEQGERKTGKVSEQTKKRTKTDRSVLDSIEFKTQEKFLKRMSKQGRTYFEEATTLAHNFSKDLQQPDIITTDKYIRKCRKWARNAYLGKYLPFLEPQAQEQASRNPNETEARTAAQAQENQNQKPDNKQETKAAKEALVTESNSVTVCQDLVLITKNEKFHVLPLPTHVANNFNEQNKSSNGFKKTLEEWEKIHKVLGVGVLDGNRVGVVYKPKEEDEKFFMSIYSSIDGKMELQEELRTPNKWKSNYGCSIWSTTIKTAETEKLVAIIGYYRTNQIGVRLIEQRQKLKRSSSKSKEITCRTERTKESDALLPDSRRQVVPITAVSFSNIDVDDRKADNVQLLRFNYCHEINKGVFVAKCTNRARLIKIIQLTAIGKEKSTYRVLGREVAPAERDDWRPWSSCITSPGLVFIKDGTRNVVDLFHTGGQHVMCLDNRSSVLILKHGDLISDMSARRIGKKTHLFFHSNTSATFQLNEIQCASRSLKLTDRDEQSREVKKLDCKMTLLLAKNDARLSDHVWSVVQMKNDLAVCDSAEKQVILCKMNDEGTFDAQSSKVAFKWHDWISGMCKADEVRLLLATHDSLLLINVENSDNRPIPLQYSRYSNYNRAYLFVSAPKEKRKPFILIENLYTSTLRQLKDVRFDNDVISFSQTCLWKMTGKKPGVMAYGADCDLIALSFTDDKSEIYKVAVLKEDSNDLKMQGSLKKPEKAEWRFVNMTFGGNYCFVNCSLSGLISVYNAKSEMIYVFSDTCMGLALTTLRKSDPQPADASTQDGKEGMEKGELSTLKEELPEVVILGGRPPKEGLSIEELTGLFKISLAD